MTGARRTSAGEGRLYQLAPPDRTGAILGLSYRTVATLTLGLVVSVLAFSKGAVPVAVGAAVMCAASVVVRVDGGPLVETLPIRIGWLRSRILGRHQWEAPLPLPVSEPSPAWPPHLEGIELLGCDRVDHGIAGIGDVAIVWDHVLGLASATIGIAGRHFGLVDPAEQDGVVSAWGDALAGFVRERTPIVQLCWNEWAAPAGVAEHLSYLDRHCQDPESLAAVSYRELVASSGASTTRHEVAVTLSVQTGRGARTSGETTTGRPRRTKGRDVRDAAIRTLLSEMRLFAERLRSAGLQVSSPWDVPTTCQAIRARLDPTGLKLMDLRSASLGTAAGLIRRANTGPLATDSAWTWWRADGCFHRSFYVSDWPRLSVPAGWMAALVGWAGAVRAITVVMEPVSPRQSAQAVRRAATKLDSDTEHRASQGFRVGAGLRRAAQAVAEREEELIAGYRELTYAGVVTVTASTLDELEVRSEDLIQVAGGSGVELRPLHGRHDQAFAVCLPVGRGLAAPRRWSL